MNELILPFSLFYGFCLCVIFVCLKFFAELFYKKASGFSRQSLESLSAESETSAAFAKRRMGEFSIVKQLKRGKPSPGVSLIYKNNLSTVCRAVIRLLSFYFVL